MFNTLYYNNHLSKLKRCKYSFIIFKIHNQSHIYSLNIYLKCLYELDKFEYH